MAAKGDWTLDPNTRANLATISKKEGAGNDKCCDCGAPSPQWASPKFSTFICLQCAGVHRGLGVHISFVRSVSMDQWKHAEISRMEHGGNNAWKAFFGANSSTSFEETSIKQRYESEVGEEWKERLTCRVEGREFDKSAFEKERAEVRRRQASRSATPAAGTTNPRAAAVSSSGPGSRTASPGPNRFPTNPDQKSQNEAYFARMGDANASRPDGVAPSQGGKYAGFGSAMPESDSQRSGAGLPSTDEFSKDPVAALTKGFGWFGGMVSKQAKMVNESIIQPTAKNIAASDFAAQAGKAAAAAGQGIQTGAKGAAQSFNKFVEGGNESTSPRAGPERKDFWDSFGATGESGSGSLGTSAMKKNPPGQGGSTARRKEDGWGDDW